MNEAEMVIKRIADVANSVAWQAGIGGMELAGQIISALAERPELIDRFLKEGHVLLLEEEMGPERGCLTFLNRNGKVTTPQELRIAKQVRSLERGADR